MLVLVLVLSEAELVFAAWIGNRIRSGDSSCQHQHDSLEAALDGVVSHMLDSSTSTGLRPEYEDEHDGTLGLRRKNPLRA